MLLALLACSDGFPPVGGGSTKDTSVAPNDTGAPDGPPSVGLLAPHEGQLFDEDDDILCDVAAGDVETAATALVLSWGGLAASLGPSAVGGDGTVDFQLGTWPIGDYSVSVTVTDAAGGTAEAAVSFSVAALDVDDDGFDNEALGGTDCDDADAAVNPDADETCNERDDDCDGSVDERVETTWSADADGDGYGDATTTEDACEAPEGYVLDDTDCDDANAAAFPGNPETCDGADNDCNGAVDDGVLTTYYLDADGDGWGDAASTAEDCSLPAGYAEAPGDCLDSDAAVSPDGTEVCQDGLDNDCDGTSNGCGLSGSHDMGTANAQLRGADTLDYAGTSVAAAGDVNGDGLADLLVGAPGAGDAGAAYVVPGPQSGTADLDAVATLVLTGEATGDGAGYALTGAGDGNVAIGAYDADASAGAVYVLRGGGSGTASLSTADLVLTGEAAGDEAGAALDGGADATGDGVPDLLVGAWSSDAGGSYSGAAYLVAGGTSGSLNLGAADLVLTGESSGDFAGFSVALVGDADGDGIADLLVGGWGDADAGSSAGAAWLVAGGQTGSLDLGAADAKFTGEEKGDRAGAAVSGGDTDGDGYADLVVGAYLHDYGSTDAGAAYVILGASLAGDADLSAADAQVVGEGEGDEAGWSLDAASDMDGDGRDELLVGALVEDAGGTDAGAVYLCYGPVDSLYDLGGADAKLYGANDGDYAGASVAGVGDTDGDGRGDILLGAPYEDDGGSYLGGSAYLILGTGL
jgi:hypothetical protein